jgi:hypothetical protein
MKGQYAMAAANQNFVLWAVPRFRRPVEQLTQGKGPNLANSGPSASADGGGELGGILKTIAEGISESPDGAACLYACHAMRHATYWLPAAQLLPV